MDGMRKEWGDRDRLARIRIGGWLVAGQQCNSRALGVSAEPRFFGGREAVPPVVRATELVCRIKPDSREAQAL